MGYRVVPNMQNMPTCRTSKMFQCADQRPFRWTNRKCTLLMANRMYVLPWPTDKGRANVSTKYVKALCKKNLYVFLVKLCVLLFPVLLWNFLRFCFHFPRPFFSLLDYSQRHWINFIAQNTGMKKNQLPNFDVTVSVPEKEHIIRGLHFVAFPA